MVNHKYRRGRFWKNYLRYGLRRWSGEESLLKSLPPYPEAEFKTYSAARPPEAHFNYAHS